MKAVSMMACILSCAFAFAHQPASNCLFVARSALRDGLWALARRAAVEAGGPESHQIIAESFAREGDWEQLIVYLPSEEKSPWALYYHALALDMKGESDAALKMLATGSFGDGPYKRMAAMLSAKILLSKGLPGKASEVLSAAGVTPDTDEARLLFADIHHALGEQAVARSLWSGLISSTQSQEKVVVKAAVKLADIPVLEKLSTSVRSPSQSELVLTALAGALLDRNGPGDIERAKEVLGKTVSINPEAPGVREMSLRLAGCQILASKPEDALKTYDEAIATWTELSRDYQARYGRGWALLGLGRAAEAALEFEKAAASTTNAEFKASAMIKEAEAFHASGSRDKAEKLYERVVGEFPGTKAASGVMEAVKTRKLEKTGDDFYNSFNFTEAENAYRAVAQADPSRVSAMNYRIALCRYGRGEDKEAETLMRALAADKKDATSRLAAIWLAKYLYNQRRYDQSHGFFLQYAAATDKDDAPGAVYWAARAAFEKGDYDEVVRLVTEFAGEWKKTDMHSSAFLLQAEALLELARFDEAVLVLERVIAGSRPAPEEKLRAALRKADALFAMGADNADRYRAALEAYRTLRRGEALSPSMKLTVSYKIARTLDKLEMRNEAVEGYYSEVLLEYRSQRGNGVEYDDEAEAAFSRAGFVLADEYESRGMNNQAVHILEIVAGSDVPAAAEAARRIEHIKTKGVFK